MRDRARAVLGDGGDGGCSVMYRLARLGWDDVVLVERAELTSGDGSMVRAAFGDQAYRERIRLFERG